MYQNLPRTSRTNKIKPLRFKFRYVLINLLSYIQVIKLHIWCRIERERVHRLSRMTFVHCQEAPHYHFRWTKYPLMNMRSFDEISYRYPNHLLTSYLVDFGKRFHFISDYKKMCIIQHLFYFSHIFSKFLNLRFKNITIK